jgi:ATP adenylyltransferase
MKYIEQSNRPTYCIFCKAGREEPGSENLVVARGTFAFVILNRYPYTTGHLMVVPYAHQPTFEVLNAETRAEIFELANRATRVLRNVYHPEGFNLGANIGAVAGAGIAAHVHLHVLPRWAGDTNFVTSVAGTRVLPENLEDTYARMREAW